MSALTSLLVRDEVVSVRQIEDALARQVLEGGELDTALLELDAVSENALNAYCAACFRLPSVARDEVMSVSAATRSLLPDELARRFRLIPITHDTNTLVVATAAPLSESARSEIGSAIGMRVECCIASEVRIQAALALYYAAPLSVRMERLVSRVDRLPAGPLPLVLPIHETPISGLAAELFDDFDDDNDEAALEPPTRPSDVTMGRVVQVATAAAAAANDPGAALPGPDLGHGPPAASQTAAEIAGAVAAVGARAAEPAIPVILPRNRGRTTVSSKRTKKSPGLPQGPVSREVASGLLERADERDTVVDVFFRYARQYFDATALFSIREDRVLGREVHNVPDLTDIRDLTVAVVRGSTLDELVRTLLPQVGDLTRREEDHPLVEALRRGDAQPSILLPVAIQRRVVSVIYGDRGGEYFRQSDLGPLIELLPEVSRAFERIIRTRKVLGLNARASSIASASAMLGNAATQLDVSAVGRGDTAEQTHAEALLRNARRALSALGAPRTAPPPPAAAPRMAAGSTDQRPPRGRPSEAVEPDRLPTARLPAVSSEPAPAPPAAAHAQTIEQPEPSPRGTGYLSKPPPGAGRYTSMLPAEPAEQGEQPSFEPLSPREPPRSNRAARAKRLADKPSEATMPASRASKPPPGTGTYRSHEVSSEVIGLAPAARTTRSSVPPVQQPAAPRRSQPPRPMATAPAQTHAQPRGEPTPAIRRSSKRPPAPDARREERSEGVKEPSSPELARPPKAARSPLPPLEASVIVDTESQVSALVDDLCKCGPDDEGPTVNSLLRVGDDALGPLIERFPGPLWFDRRRPYSRLPFGRDTGPVARALAAFGESALPRMVGLLRSNQPDVRYYATLFVSDQVHPDLLLPIADRLFDDDPQIRLMVRDALPLYRHLAAFVQVLGSLRTRSLEVRAALPARLAAIDALCMLRDGESVPSLIELLTHADRQLSVPAHRALVAITCQDFGTAARKWRSWYEDNQHRHRVQWLIESLMHGEQNLRSAAGVELQKVTQVYYGYVASAPKRDRERAQRRYQDWWDSEGRKKM